MKTSPDRNLTRIYLAGLNVPSLLLFPQPIPVSGSIDTLLRHAATFVERECPLESAEQAGLRRCSTVWQQGHGSRRCLVLQVHQYLLNDHWIFNAGNDPGVASIDSAPLNINAEYPLEPLGPGHRRMTLNRGFVLAIHCFGLATLAPLCRRHQRTVLAVRGKYTVESRQVHSRLGHQCGQLGNEIHRLEDDVGGANNSKCNNLQRPLIEGHLESDSANRDRCFHPNQHFLQHILWTDRYQ